MNFYIRKNSTLPKLIVEVFIDDGNSFWSSNDDFSASTITFNMKSEETGFYTIINKPVSVKVKRSTNSGPIKSYYLETQFTQKETSKLGSYITEFKIIGQRGTEILPIQNEIIVNVIDSFANPDMCCRPNVRVSPTPQPTPTSSIGIRCELVVVGTTNEITPTTTPSGTPTITPSNNAPTLTLTGLYFNGSIGAGYSATISESYNSHIGVSFTDVLSTTTTLLL